MSENLFELDLSRFTRSDREKIRELGDKLKLMRRWFRHEIVRGDDGDVAQLYSGNRGPTRYAHYRILRDPSGSYTLLDGSSDEQIHEGRTIAAVIDAIPDDFFYSDRAP